MEQCAAPTLGSKLTILPATPCHPKQRIGA